MNMTCQSRNEKIFLTTKTERELPRSMGKLFLLGGDKVFSLFHFTAKLISTCLFFHTAAADDRVLTHSEKKKSFRTETNRRFVRGAKRSSPPPPLFACEGTSAIGRKFLATDQACGEMEEEEGRPAFFARGGEERKEECAKVPVPLLSPLRSNWGEGDGKRRAFYLTAAPPPPSQTSSRLWAEREKGGMGERCLQTPTSHLLPHLRS